MKQTLLRTVTLVLIPFLVACGALTPEEQRGGGLEPTSTPTPERPPTNTPAPQAPPDAPTACSNDYLPLAAGTVWTFDTSEGSMTWTVVSASGDMASATAVVQIEGEGGSVNQVTYQCDEGGILKSGGTVGGEAVVYGQAVGIEVPAAAALAQGAPWTYAYDTTQGDQQTSITRGCQVTQSLSVSFAGTDHPALEIKCEGLQIKDGVRSTTTVTEVWAKGIGPVSHDETTTSPDGATSSYSFQLSLFSP